MNALRLFFMVALVSIPTSEMLAQPQPLPPSNSQERLPSLTATGRGVVSATPDQAVVRLGAIGEAKDASQAQGQVNQIMDRVIKAMGDLGIPAKSVQTTGIAISPIHSHPQPTPGWPPAEPEIVGFRARNTIQVQIEDLALVAKVIDGGVLAGANELEGLHFQLKDDLDARQRALSEAARNARVKAHTLAEALNVQLGNLIEIAEGGARAVRPPDFMPTRMVQMEMHATPVQPGEVQVEAEVTLVYRINSAE